MDQETKKKLLVYGGGGAALLLLALAFKSKNQTAMVTPIVAGDPSGGGYATSGNDASMYFAQYAKESQANMMDIVKAVTDSNAGLRQDIKESNTSLRDDLKGSNQQVAETLKESIQGNQAATNNALQQMASGMSNLFAKYDPQAFFGTLQGQIDGLNSKLDRAGSFTAAVGLPPNGAGTQAQPIAQPQNLYETVSRQPVGYSQEYQQDRLLNFQNAAKAGFSTPIIGTAKPNNQPVVHGTVVSITDRFGNVRSA